MLANYYRDQAGSVTPATLNEIGLGNKSSENIWIFFRILFYGMLVRLILN